MTTDPILPTFSSVAAVEKEIMPQGHKNFMLNSTEHEIHHAHKC